MKFLNFTTVKKKTANTQQVIPLGNGWVVRNASTGRFIIITDTKREAIRVAEDLAKKKGSELVIHGKDGKIQSKQSFAKAS
jgi:hypothetical protein